MPGIYNRKDLPSTLLPDQIFRIDPAMTECSITIKKALN